MGNKTSALLAVLAILSMGSFARAEDAPAATNRFYTAVDVVEPRTAITRSGQFSLGVSLDSLLPFGAPFVESATGVENRYQVASAAALDFNLGFSQNFEAAFSIGYMGFQSRFEQVYTTKRIDTAKFSALPSTKLIARYYFNQSQGIATTVEGGFGVAFGTVKIETTNGGIDAIKEKKTSFSGHVGAGIALGWAEDYTAHLLVGYSVYTLGAKTHTTTVYTMDQKSSIAGAYMRAQVRYQF